MSSRQERFAERQQFHYGEKELDPSTYNLAIGGTLAYGFVINCIMVATCADLAFNLFSNTIIFYILYFRQIIFYCSLVIYRICFHIFSTPPGSA